MTILAGVFMAKKPNCNNCIHGDKYDKYCRLNCVHFEQVIRCTQYVESKVPKVNKCKTCKHCTARSRCTVGIMNCRAMYEPKEINKNASKK
nr:MAG TPA: hypothetical protein [Caudoviricetes sp.]